MAYGVNNQNNYTLKHMSQADNPNQMDMLWFTDFHQGVSPTAAIYSEGGVFMLQSGSGGAISNNNTAILTAFGITAASGTVQLQTGTTSNSSGSAAIVGHYGNGILGVVPGIPTPITGTTTKYEWEALIRTGGSIFSAAASTGGAFRFGLMDSATGSLIADGVYFEFLNNGTTNDTTFWIVWRKTSAQERYDTGVTYAANKTYRLYMSVEMNAAGTLTTSYKIKNLTDGTNTEGTATPSDTSKIPTAADNYMFFCIEINKTVNVTATSTALNLDYVGCRIRRSVARERLIQV